MCGDSWKLCSTGKHQSPISISTETAIPDLNIPLTSLRFKSVFATSYNRSGLAEIEVATPSQEAYLVGGPTNGFFYLFKMSFHTPSEHAFDDFRAAASAQFWFKDAKGSPAVILDLMFIDNTEQPNPWLETVLQAMRANSTTLDLNPAGIFPTDLTYYFYSGSESTPPCTEGWTWMILRQPIPVTLAQVRAIRNWQGVDHIRPLQPLYGRNVTLEFAHILVEEDPNTFVALISVFALICLVGGILAIIVNRQANEAHEKQKAERLAYIAAHQHQ